MTPMIFCLLALTSWITAQASSEDLLRRDLFEDYDASHYPPNVRLIFGISYRNCPELDVATGMLTSQVYLTYKWRDNRLEWQPHYYDGVSRIHVETSDVWTPGVKVANALSEDYSTGGFESLSLQSTGELHWLDSAEYVSSCDRNENALVWNCELRFQSWKYAGDEFRLIPGDSSQPVVSERRCSGVQAESHIEKVGVSSSAFYYYVVRLQIPTFF